MNSSDTDSRNLRLLIVAEAHRSQAWLQQLTLNRQSEDWMMTVECLEPATSTTQVAGLLDRLVAAELPAKSGYLICLVDVNNDGLLALAVLNWLAEQGQNSRCTQTQIQMGMMLYGLDSFRLRDTLSLYADAANLGKHVLLPVETDGDDWFDVVHQFRLQLVAASKDPQPDSANCPQMSSEAIAHGLQNDQFELYYQPKIDMTDFSLRGTEALLRWQHPDLGLLGPASFLSQAEAGGLVAQLTLQVLKMAIRDLRLFRSHGMMKPVAVNLSPLALADAGLANRLVGEINAAGLPPSAILFEITEYTDMADVRAALNNLLVLHCHAYQLSLDDFGAGHGSVLQLSRFPFSELKLDKRLVTDAWRRPHVAAMLKQTVQAARSAGILTVAEGIESWQDWHLMQSIGCHKAQGYLIARPMPMSAMLGWSGECFSRHLDGVC